MRIKSIPEQSCLTLENLAAWETKNHHWKKYNSKQKYEFIYLFIYVVKAHHAHLQVSRDLKETM